MGEVTLATADRASIKCDSLALRERGASGPVGSQKPKKQKRRRAEAQAPFSGPGSVQPASRLNGGRSEFLRDRPFGPSGTLAPVERQVGQFALAHADNCRMGQRVGAVICRSRSGPELAAHKQFHHEVQSPYCCFSHGQIPFLEFSYAVYIRGFSSEKNRLLLDFGLDFLK